MNDTSDLAVEVQDLVWRLLDEQVTDQQICRLEELLRTNNQARRIYMACIQLHVDLHRLVGGKQGWRPGFAKASLPASPSSVSCQATAAVARSWLPRTNDGIESLLAD
jgi:hypothetical protein